MCKYCIDIGKTSGEDLERETIDKRISLGEIGEYYMRIFLGNGYGFEPTMYIWITPYLGDPVIDKRITIKYCPFCGRRLKKEQKS